MEELPHFDVSPVKKNPRGKVRTIVSSPNKKKLRLSVTDKIEDFDKNAIRQKIHNFWLRREIPTLSKMLIAINDDPTLPNLKRTSSQSILKDLNFSYTKICRNSALTERAGLICWRQKYIEDIRYHRSRGRPIYYLDETWVNAGETISKSWIDNTITSHRDAFVKGLTTGQKTPSGKGKRLIVVHIGSTEGFVVGGLLVFKSKKNSGDYHEEMNGDTFFT